MLTKIVETADETIAHIYDLRSINKKSFPTPHSFPMQFGIGICPETWVSPAHIHRPVKREVTGTAEFIFLMEGQLEIVFFDSSEQEIGHERLEPQMALLQIAGGHMLTFLAGSRYFELKQGPYHGHDWDKYELGTTP